jgi:methyl-galactoside transport system substrate-binding protein
MVSIMISMMLINYKKNLFVASSMPNSRLPVKAAVVVQSFDPYSSLIRKNLEQIQKENSDKIEFEFFDSNHNQNTQNQIIDSLLQKNIDLLLLNLVSVDESMVDTIINKIKQKNIPVIFFFRSQLATMNSFNSYPKAFIIGSNSQEAGTLQGKLLVNLWNSNKAAMDKNHDNILQYIMLKGPRTLSEASQRTKYSILTINDAGIKTQELASQVGNWNKELAKTAIDSLFLNYGDKIEAIISNNDAMAIGAIEALQKYGYNKGDKLKTIPVVGVDGISEARDLIKKGFMAGTVVQDARSQSEALYSIGMNLVNNKNPLEGTNYKLYNNQKVVYIPFKGYITE